MGDVPRPWAQVPRQAREDVLEGLSVRAEALPEGELREAMEAAIRALETAAGVGTQGRWW